MSLEQGNQQDLTPGMPNPCPCRAALHTLQRPGRHGERAGGHPRAGRVPAVPPGGAVSPFRRLPHHPAHCPAHFVMNTVTETCGADKLQVPSGWAFGPVIQGQREAGALPAPHGRGLSAATRHRCMHGWAWSRRAASCCMARPAAARRRSRTPSRTRQASPSCASPRRRSSPACLVCEASWR